MEVIFRNDPDCRGFCFDLKSNSYLTWLNVMGFSKLWPSRLHLIYHWAFYLRYLAYLWLTWGRAKLINCNVTN